PTLQSSFFYSTLPPPPRSPLFPYTTLFRSRGPATASSSPSGRPRIDLSCSASSGSLDSARAAEPAHVGDQLTDLFLRQGGAEGRSEEHTSELQSRFDLVCRLLLEKKKKKKY